MTRAEVAKLFMVINYTYQSFTIDETKIEVWFDLLQDLPFEVAQQNLRQHIRTDKYPPTIADLRRMPVPELTQHQLLREETRKRLAIMEEWRAKAAPPPWLVEGGKRPT